MSSIISTFSGGGFLDMGFLKAGFNIVDAVEINQPFIDAYNYGINSFLKQAHKSKSISRDVTHNEIDKPIDISNLKEHALLQKKHYGIDGLIGGPPCQDYSIGGNNVGVTGERGKLIYSYYELVKSLSPNFIFFENVSGLYNTKSHQCAFYDLVNKLQKSGYTVWYKILNSLEYGVPQDRPRLVLVGFKSTIVKRLIEHNYRIIEQNEYSDMSVFRWPVPKLKQPKLKQWPTVWNFGSDVIEDEVNNIPKKYHGLFISSAFSKINSGSPNQNESFLPYSKKFNTIKEGDTYRKSFKRLHRFRYSPTVAYGNNEVHLHPTEARRLTVREALTLQSVPMSYVLPNEVPLTHKFKLISNGVPTLKAHLIANEIKRTLDNYYATL